MSMPVITLTSSSKAGIANPPEISKNFREASFSSNLDGAEETFLLKFGGPRTQGLSSSISTAHDHVFLGKNRADDREIDVFDAEKYFNEGLYHSPKASAKNLSSHQHNKDDQIEIFAIKEQPPIAALTIRSESSWNSRSALLHTVPRNQQPRKPNKKSFLASIGCNCSCADKNSVDIDDHIGEKSSNKSISTGLVNGKSEQGDKTSDHLLRTSQSDYSCVKFDEPALRVNSNGHFSFPVFNSKTGNQAAKMLLQGKEDAAKRKSVDVFGSPVLENGKNCFSMEKKLTTATWDAIAPLAAEEIKIPSICSEMHNDGDSDASSDLFEIESFSKGNPFLSRQASDGLSGCVTPTTGYAPSEASIEWSVVTASAADFSVVSDSEEVTSSITIPVPKKVGINSKVGSFKEIPKMRPSILSGCKSHKAVSVAGDAYRPNEQGFSHARRHLRVDSFTPTTGFRDESSKLASFDAKSRQQSFDARIVSQPRTGSSAHLLYT